MKLQFVVKIKPRNSEKLDLVDRLGQFFFHNLIGELFYMIGILKFIHDRTRKHFFTLPSCNFTCSRSPQAINTH